MTKEELKTKFDGLYAYMAMSREPKYMMLFGDVMRHMMEWMIENKPEAAEKYIETLCAVKWRQYLTRSEAMEIFENMVPSGAWNYDAWIGAMKNLGLEYERESVFNCYALWVVMNAIHSDNGKVIAGLMGLQPTDTGNTDYIKTLHSLAMNKLMDVDGYFEIRDYYLK
jgi:hypothetical protein